MEWYLMALRRFADFKGRSQRKEYWMYLLFNCMAIVLLSFVGGALGRNGAELLVNLYTLITLVPSVAVGVRRLHDIGKSGWWLLLGFLPVIGTLVLLYFAIKDGEPGVNQYGANPKDVPAPAA